MSTRTLGSAGARGAGLLLDIIRDELAEGETWNDMDRDDQALSAFGTALRRLALQTHRALNTVEANTFERSAEIANVCAEFIGLSLHAMPEPMRGKVTEVVTNSLKGTVEHGDQFRRQAEAVH